MGNCRFEFVCQVSSLFIPPNSEVNSDYLRMGWREGIRVVLVLLVLLMLPLLYLYESLYAKVGTLEVYE